MSKDIAFVTNLKNDIELDIKKIVNKLDTNALVKFILIMFENELFSPSNLAIQSSLFSKEDIAEELSYVLSLKVSVLNSKISLGKVITADYFKFTKKYHEQLNSLLELLRARSIVREIEIYITKQGYELSIKDNIISVEHPIKDFKHYYQMGYLRNTLENITIGLNTQNNGSMKFENIFDMMNNHFLDTMPILNYEIRSEGTTKESIIFSIDAGGIANLHRFLTDEHDMRYNQISNKYLEYIDANINDNCTKKGNIKWIDLLNFSIVLQYLITYMNKVIDEKSTSQRMKINSRLLLFTNTQKSEFILEILQTINPEIIQKDVQAFLSKFSTSLDNSTGRIDLQFQPIVKVKEHSFILFNTFTMVDMVRAYIKNYNISLDDQGEKFEGVVYEKLSKHFNQIYPNIKYLDETKKKGEIDICIIGDKHIYFIECKNNLHPISASTASTNYQNFLKATDQVAQAENYFNLNRIDFLKKHLQLKIEDIEEYTLHKVVIKSNRNIAGLNYKDIAFRDIYSLDKLLGDGCIREYTQIPGENKKLEKIIYMHENKKSFQEIDFINYLSEKSIYFEVLNNLIKKAYKEVNYKEYIIRDSIYAFDILKK